MSKYNLPKSIRRFIRDEKAKIRRELLDSQKQNEAISALYKKFLKANAN